MERGAKRIHVILNPVAGGGQGNKLQSRLFAGIRERFGRDYSLHVTRGPGEATVSARWAINAGASLIIAVGGDGTVQETANAFFNGEKLIDPSCQLGIINCGTGHGLAQSLYLPSSLEEQLDLICCEETRAIDVGRVEYRDSKGRKRERIFLSECQMGIGGSVVARVSVWYKRFGGTFAFGFIAISMAIAYKALPMTIQLDDMEKINEQLIGIVVGNGPYCGGGMNLTPAAQTEDGMFDVLLIHEMGLLKRLWSFPKIYFGKHVDSPHFSIYHGARILVDSKDPVPVEADGELLGTLPCKIKILPAALQVRCNPVKRKKS